MKNEFKQLAKQYDLQLLILFGSRAKGTIKPNSDWDFAYLGDLTHEQETALWSDLADMLKTDTIDLLNIKHISSTLFLFRVFNEGKCIYEYKHNFFSSCKTAARLDYIGYLPRLKKRHELILKSVGDM